jgi:ethanolamine ammonia-lyase small subunit
MGVGGDGLSDALIADGTHSACSQICSDVTWDFLLEGHRVGEIPGDGSEVSSAMAKGLRRYTAARVGLERAGSSVATRHQLEFALAHAQARDAVHSELDVPKLLAGFGERWLAAIAVRSAASGRVEYLRRPDLGRTLSEESEGLLGGVAGAEGDSGARVAVVVGDGLSALAVERHAVALIEALLPLLARWVVAPIVVAEQARVALGDAVGRTLGTDAVVMLIGERPGLSAADSLGAYITWRPGERCTDAERNCVSNIRAGGLDYATAARKIAWYLNEGRRLGLTGVAIREPDAGIFPGSVALESRTEQVRPSLEL